MKISETFLSIQGEGKSAGTPAVFIRFSGCNLSCPDCDTKYHTEHTEVTAEEITEIINGFNPVSKRVIFTGGEPLLYQQDIINIIKALNPKNGKQDSYMNWNFEIETNGTIKPELIHKELGANWSNILIRYNVSPKLSQFNENNEIDYRVLYYFLMTFPATFKFVVKDLIDLEEVKEIVKKASIKPELVYLMPWGKTREEQIKLMPIVVEMCKETGFKLSPRLHVLIWGNEKGI